MTLTPRLVAQIALGLAADVDINRISEDLLAGARAVGLTGAEIDAALRGDSFDVLDAAVMALSRAYRRGSSSEIRRHRERAIQSGLSQADADAVRGISRAYVTRHPAPATGDIPKKESRKVGPARIK